MPRREYVDKLECTGYNKKLVRHGELYFSFEFLDSWMEDPAQQAAGYSDKIIALWPGRDSNNPRSNDGDFRADWV